MEKRNPRRTVLPGDSIADANEYKPGDNTYEVDNTIYSSVLGTVDFKGNKVNVIPIGGRYVPSVGDTVIGIITDIGPSNWMADIKQPWPAPLHVSEVPWKVDFGDTSAYLLPGNVVLLKVIGVDEAMKVSVTMKDSGLRKIEGGEIIEINHHKISRVIGKAGSMISMIKNMTDCRITVGQNGRIWIDGEEENVAVATAAIKKIEAESRMPNLTEKVEKFIAERLPGSESYNENDEEEESE